MSRVETNPKSQSTHSATSKSLALSNSAEPIEAQLEDFQSLIEEVYQSCSRYFKQRPAVASGVLVAIGFYLGWKIRP